MGTGKHRRFARDVREGNQLVCGLVVGDSLAKKREVAGALLSTTAKINGVDIL